MKVTQKMIFSFLIIILAAALDHLWVQTFQTKAFISTYLIAVSLISFLYGARYAIGALVLSCLKLIYSDFIQKNSFAVSDEEDMVRLFIFISGSFALVGLLGRHKELVKQEMPADLGLSIAKGIVETHGGQISTRSKFGEGTSFYFTIPKEVD